MPSARHTSLKGNLYINFKVHFPESGFLPSEEDRKVCSLTAELRTLLSYSHTFSLSYMNPLQELQGLLPRASRLEEPSEEAEEVDMIEFEGTKGEGGSQGGEAYDSSDEEAGPRGGHSTVGCSQQ